MTEAKKANKLLRVLATVFAVATCLVVIPQFAPAKTLPAGTPLRYDDFEFVVGRAEGVTQIGSQRPASGMKYVILDVVVKNVAKRVEFTFDPVVVTPFSGDGVQLSRDSATQITLENYITALGRHIKKILAPGESESYRLVYTAPERLTDINVQFRFGGPVGVFFDNISPGKRQVSVKVEKN